MEVKEPAKLLWNSEIIFYSGEKTVNNAFRLLEYTIFSTQSL